LRNKKKFQNSSESNKTHSCGHVEECGGKITIWKTKVTQHYSQCVKIGYKLKKHTSISNFTKKRTFEVVASTPIPF
jgi:hypothetical protein